MFPICENCCLKLSWNWNTSRKSFKIAPFIKKYNWNEIKYPSKLEDWKMFEKNNLEIALNVLYAKDTEILPAYISNHNSIQEKKIILLVVSNEENEKEGWHYLAVKKSSALLWRKTSNRDSNFYCLNCLHSFRTENKLNSHEKACKDKDFCSIEISSEKNEILKLNQ